jgi:hypothetical protein
LVSLFIAGMSALDLAKLAKRRLISKALNMMRMLLVKVRESGEEDYHCGILYHDGVRMMVGYQEWDQVFSFAPEVRIILAMVRLGDGERITVAQDWD